jgi:small GTP-binding protein
MSCFKLKILLLGAAAVGKTSLVQRFIKNRFAANYKLTVGVDISSKDVEYKPGEITTLSIWDIGSQRRFEFIRSTFYKGAAGAILVFDLTQEKTYSIVRNWLSEFKHIVGETIPFVLIGNNADLVEDVVTVIDRQEVQKYAKNKGGFYTETSSKKGEHIDESFIELNRQIINSRSHYFLKG